MSEFDEDEEWDDDDPFDDDEDETDYSDPFLDGWTGKRKKYNLDEEGEDEDAPDFEDEGKYKDWKKAGRAIDDDTDNQISKSEKMQKADKKEQKQREIAKQRSEEKSGRKLQARAKELGFPPYIMPYKCPLCHKSSLFMDKYSGQFKRAILSRTIGLYQDSIFRFVCLNKQCRGFWPNTGTTFSVQAGTVLREHKNIFHIIR